MRGVGCLSQMRAPKRRDTWPSANLASTSPTAAAAGPRFDFASQSVLSPSSAQGPTTAKLTESSNSSFDAKREMYTHVRAGLRAISCFWCAHVFVL